MKILATTIVLGSLVLSPILGCAEETPYQPKTDKEKVVWLNRALAVEKLKQTREWQVFKRADAAWKKIEAEAEAKAKAKPRDLKKDH